MQLVGKYDNPQMYGQTRVLYILYKASMQLYSSLQSTKQFDCSNYVNTRGKPVLNMYFFKQPDS